MKCTIWKLANVTTDFAWIMVITDIPLSLLTLSWDFCCCVTWGSSHRELTVVCREWVAQVIFVFSLKLMQKKKHKFGRKLMYILSFCILWHDPNGNPKMLATSRMVILLFSKTSSFPQSITASAVLISGSSKQSASSTEVMPLWDLENHGKNLCSVHCLLSKS